MQNILSDGRVMNKRLININELSELIGLSVNTLYSWVSQQRIPYYKIGSTVRFDISEIGEWLKNQKVGVSDKI